MLKVLVFLIWLMIPLGLWLAVVTWGTPYLVLSYRFHDNGRPYDPMTPRVYISCDYLGLDGWITVPAQRGACPWVRFFKVDG